MIVKLCPWYALETMDAFVCRGLGLGVVFWPSGVRTLLQYMVPAVVSGRDLRRQHNPDALKHAMEQNILLAAEDLRAYVHPDQWLVVRKHGRRQARRVTAIAWFHPDAYIGPPIPASNHTL